MEGGAGASWRQQCVNGVGPNSHGWMEHLNARFLMPPQRPVILDAELCEHARGKPVRVPLAGHGKLNDLFPHKLGHLIVRGHGELERDAHSLKGPVHGLDVLGLESESTGSRPYHYHGAADGLERALSRPFRRLQLAADQSVTGPGRSRGGRGGDKMVDAPAGPGTATIDRESWPRSAVGGGGYIGPGPCSLGEQAQPISICACKDRERPPARGLFLLLGLTPTPPGPKAPRSA